jgi:hypothetical protein
MNIHRHALASAAILVLASWSLRAESNAPAATDTSVAPAQAAPSIEVLRMVLTKVVENREPVGEITSAGVGEPVVGFTQVQTSGGETSITHRWLHEGANMGDVPLTVRSSPWRTWSRKTVHAPGNWTFQVLGPDGNVLKETAFNVSATAAAAESVPPAAPASTPAKPQ